MTRHTPPDSELSALLTWLAVAAVMLLITFTAAVPS